MLFDFRAFFVRTIGVTGLGLCLLLGVTQVRGLEGGGRSLATVRNLGDPHVVVLKSKRELHLFDGARLVRSYPVDLGTSPTGAKQLRGDGRTPEGVFRVVSRNPDSPYHRFLGIGYPDEAAIREGLRRGLITQGQAQQMLESYRAGRCPDWSTSLGGGVGLHGHRRGRDWTGGCIALSDGDIDELFSVLRLGDTVEVLP